MDKTFNELFDDFFKRHNINPNHKLTDDAKEKAKQMIEMLGKTNDNPKIDEDTEKEMDAQLGKPDKIEFFNEGDLFFERRIWHTPNGDIQKLLFTKDESLLLAPKPEDLQKKLEEAVEAEHFEKAAAIRDEIKRRKKLAKKSK